MNNTNLPNRVELGGAGIGEISDAAIERKALQIARSDGRQRSNLKDIDEARREIMAGSGEQDDEKVVIAEEPGDGVPPVSHGTMAPRVLPDDEVNISEALIREGVEEAESDTRLHSNDDQA